MSSVRARKDNGMLFFDLRFRGMRCREQTTLFDTPKNRADMQRVLTKIDKEIAGGTFDYRRYFPNSKKASEFDSLHGRSAFLTPAQHQHPAAAPALIEKIPTFEIFAAQHYNEQGVGWRASTRDWMQSILNTHLLPAFASRPIDSICREDIL